MPRDPFELGAARLHSGDLPGAAEAFADAVRQMPGSFPALVNLGVVLARLERHPEAEGVLNAALAMDPCSEPVLTTLAGTLQAQGRSDEAIVMGQRAATADPRRPEAWCNLGAALHARGNLSAAVDAYRHALDADPDYALAVYNLSHVHNDQWQASDALGGFRRAIELDPAYQPAWHAWLFNLIYDPDQTEASIFEAHREWARRGPASAVSSGPEPSDGPGRRRVRVGYVSPDFCRHSCAYFLRPLFEGHDRERVEVFAYSAVHRPDAFTDWFREHADHWREIGRSSVAETAALIRADGIDVLVDLAGHTKNHPIGVFALRPAPVQVSWLGYPATSGLNEINYRLTDVHADPVGDADRYHSERLVRLPGGFHCYRPESGAPAVGPLPSASKGFVTFGSFNNPAKLTGEAIATWAELLRQVPRARLLMKGGILVHDAARSRIQAAFRDAGVSSDRIELRSWTTEPAGSLAMYNEVDIALDTYPYNGATTTFEALWMGVPVVTLRDQRHAGRVAASILTHSRRPEWIADDADDYMRIAMGLAEDPGRLAVIRRGLREELAQSSLMDVRGFASKLEDLYEAPHRQSVIPQGL